MIMHVPAKVLHPAIHLLDATFMQSDWVERALTEGEGPKLGEIARERALGQSPKLNEKATEIREFRFLSNNSRF